MSEGLPESNGTSPEAFAERFAAELQGEIESRESRIIELRSQVDTLVDEQRRFRASLKALTGERPGPKNRQVKRVIEPGSGTKVGEERVATIEGWIREYAADHEEFTQVDLRTAYGHFENGATFSSSIAATSFEKLRQRNVIRVARQDGNRKIYRLTREALAAVES